ncbi:unnamed protein product [Victoria cruziana]
MCSIFLRVLPLPLASSKIFQSGEHTGILEEFPFMHLPCLRVVSILARCLSSKKKEGKLWTSSPSTVGFPPCLALEKG